MGQSIARMLDEPVNTAHDADHSIAGTAGDGNALAPCDIVVRRRVCATPQLQQRSKSAPILSSNGFFGRRPLAIVRFIDLATLPEDIALTILSHLNATDLCLAACVSPAWERLADHNCLWRSLCHRTWKFLAEIPGFNRNPSDKIQWKKVYMLLDDASLLFNMDPQRGLASLVLSKALPDDSPGNVARFLKTSTPVRKEKIGHMIVTSPDIARAYISMFDFGGMPLTDALRRFLDAFHFPKGTPARSRDVVLEMFAARYHTCNASATSLPPESVFVLVCSTILLSVDLYSPQIKIKMTKREFLRTHHRNYPPALHIPEDLLCAIYDDVYVRGHVVSPDSFSSQPTRRSRHRPSEGPGELWDITRRLQVRRGTEGNGEIHMQHRAFVA
eukprot:Opistho-2@85259